MSAVPEHLAAVKNHMDAACRKVGRDPASVELIAVSKTFPAEAVMEAVEAGQRVFGESKLQEAEPKIEALPGTLRWHFIGRVQRNKVRKILARFDVVHGIDSLALATYADHIAAELGLFPEVFLQVNIGKEERKGGFEPDVLAAEIKGLLGLKRLSVQGLMCIPPEGPDAESARPWFGALRDLRDKIESEHGASLPFLSMGMSGDFGVAIEEGATHVRVGSAIFGKRAYRMDGEPG